MSLTAGSAHPRGESICVPPRHVKWTDQFVNEVDIDFSGWAFRGQPGQAEAQFTPSRRSDLAPLAAFEWVWTQAVGALAIVLNSLGLVPRIKYPHSNYTHVDGPRRRADDQRVDERDDVLDWVVRWLPQPPGENFEQTADNE